MISFRYHLITIVAIFLAIALGIVMGATFIQDPVLNQLKSQTRRLEDQNGELRSRLDALQSQTAADSAFAEQALPFLISGRLDGMRAVLLTQEGTSGKDISAARRSLEQGGANVQGAFAASAQLADASPGSLSDLAAALGRDPGTPTDPSVLLAAAAADLGRRLAQGAPTDGAVDVLQGLLEGGFLTSLGPTVRPGDLPAIGGPGTVTVIVGGGSGTPIIPIRAFLVPLIRAVADGGLALAVAQGTDSQYPFVALVLSDSSLSDSVTTVDDLDRPAGEAALVIALQDLVERGAVGHYGIEENRLLPPPPQSGG